MSNLVDIYHNPEPIDNRQENNTPGPSNYLVSYYAIDNLIIITRKDDWEERGTITDDSDQEDIIDILDGLGLISIGDSDYEMTGYIQDISTMLDELVRRGFGRNAALDQWLDVQ